jgi:uncharacterized LabA/DUF88 family protein
MDSTKHKEQRVGVFVDVQNMYYSAKNLYSAKVDFGKVLREGVAGRKLIRAFAYVIKADVGAEQVFFDALTQQGYEVRTKDLQIFYGGAKKGDWDVGLCMDVIRMLSKIDAMVLVSGDGDYTDLLDYAHSQGVRTEVIAFSQTASSKLLEKADTFIDMKAHAKKFLIKSSNARNSQKMNSKPAMPNPTTNKNGNNKNKKPKVSNISENVPSPPPPAERPN